MIIRADARSIPLRDGAVDVVITDPPYSAHVHAKHWVGSRALLDGSGRPAPCAFARAKEIGFEAISDADRVIVSRELARIARRWVLVFSDIESCGLWREALVDAGLEYVRTGTWVKLNAAPQFTGDRPAPGVEVVTICHPKGRKRWNGGGRQAVWTHPIELNRGGSAPRLHTTQKPLPLMMELVSLFSEPGEIVCDPFFGSGTTGDAAERLSRRWIGLELSEQYVTVATGRMAQRGLFAAVEQRSGD